ncbi:MAG: CehA/McbA family metallohydrolase [Planctomycetaceae bacterium]
MHKQLVPLAALCCVLGFAYWAVSQDEQNSPVEVAVLTEQNWDEFAPSGKEVDAIYGDIVLRNQYVTAVIAQPIGTRNANMTVRDVAGCLIDFTDRSNESDQLSCFYPGQRAYPFREWTVSTKNEKGLAVVGDLKLQSGECIVTVRSEGNAERPTVDVEYRLGVHSRVLQVTTRYSHHSGPPLTVTLSDDLRADGGKEDMQKAPNGTSETFWFEDHFWQQAYGIRAPGHQVQCNSDSRRTGLVYLNSKQQDIVTLKSGQSYELVREIACGPSRIDVAAAFAREDGQQVVPTELSIWDAARRAVPNASLEIRQDGKVIGRPRANRDGDAHIPLPPGSFTVKVIVNGQTVREGYELHVADAQEQRETVLLPEYHPGVLVVGVSEDGHDIPCKVEIIGREGTPTPNFGPETAEFGVKNLRYTPNGRFLQGLMPGKYSLIISHGPEYGAVFQDIEIAPGEATRVATKLQRQVDSTGWISSDFHSHSSPSGDNTGSQLGRVLNLVCEHLEFAPCTEHNRIDTYDPHIEFLKIAPFMSTTTGMELTGSPLPLNHQNVFPLHHHPHRQDGGGPVTDSDVETQMQRVSAWDNGSEKLVQQNHPDVGWLFYDKNGDGQHDGGHAQSVALIDVMEIHPIEKILESSEADGVDADEAKGNRIFKWLQVMNQGYRIPGVVNTDAHYNFHGSGWLRNWIQCPTDDPAKIDPMDIVHASEEGRVVMSNGPFLKADLTAGSKTIVCGQDVAAADGKVSVKMSVQCADWFDVDTVFVLVNGRPLPELVFTRESHPQLFRKEGALRFEHVADIQLEGDAHLVVATGGRNSTLGPVMGPQWGKMHPAALTNPFFVDVDGGGFAFSKDTLDRPLPVKGD